MNRHIDASVYWLILAVLICLGLVVAWLWRFNELIGALAAVRT